MYKALTGEFRKRLIMRVMCRKRVVVLQEREKESSRDGVKEYTTLSKKDVMYTITLPSQKLNVALR